MGNYNQILYNCKEIKNTYNFVVIDKDGKVISDQTYTNLTMPQRYFGSGGSSLTLRLGVMTERDLQKYQKNGSWKAGYGAKGDGSGGYIINTEGSKNKGSLTETIHRQETVINPETGKTETVDIDTGRKAWGFYPNIKITDEGLFGTTAFSTSLNWECSFISNGEVIILGTATIGYHSPNSSLNDGNLMSDQEDDTQYGVIYSDEGEIESIATIKDNTAVYGIQLIDGGLFTGNTCCSHFSCNIKKRPIDQLKVTVTCVFSGLNFNVGSPFLPEGSYLYGHEPGSPTSVSPRTPQLLPSGYGFSSRAIVHIDSPSGGGCVPIEGRERFSCNKSFWTDQPKDWETQDAQGERNPWAGYPRYSCFGNGDVYKTEIKRVQDGVDEYGKKKYKEIEVYSKNAKEQRIFEWSKLTKRNIFGYNYSTLGPVRTFVINGFSAISAGSVLPNTGFVGLIRIGTGNGTRTKFYHSITNETGEIENGYTPSQIASKITYYNNSDNVFANDQQMIGIYDDKFTAIYNGPANSINYQGYYKKGKIVCLQLHPFSLNYYPGFSGAGAISNWMVYNFTGTIGAAWAAAYNYSTPGGGGIGTTVYLKTADTIANLRDAPSIHIDGANGQHDQTTITNFIGRGLVAVKIPTLAVAGGIHACDVGGMTYDDYDPISIRIVSGTDVPGYIEFDTPPGPDVPVYIDVNFKIPFLYNFTSVAGKFYNVIGAEGMNGKGN